MDRSVLVVTAELGDLYLLLVGGTKQVEPDSQRKPRKARVLTLARTSPGWESLQLMEERPLGWERDTVNDNPLRSYGALSSVWRIRGTFFATGVGGVGAGPAFEMLSDLLEITKPV